MSSLVTLAVCCFFFWCAPNANGLEPSTQIAQYGHTAWPTGRSGLTSPPRAIAQTSDGYIWIGTDDGLFRFDGVHFVRWNPPKGEGLPSQNITYLFGAHNGSLYIGTELGMARLTKDAFYIYSDRQRASGPFAEDAQGNVWVGQSSPSSESGSLCKVGETNLECHGDGLGCQRSSAVLSERSGSVWLGCDARIAHWQLNKPPESYPLPALKPLGIIHALAMDQEGSLWAGATCIGSGCGLLKFSDGAWHTFRTPQVDGRKLFVQSLLLDYRNNMWIGTDRGLYKFDQGNLDHYYTTDGLTGKLVHQIFEDKERNLWVVTSAGLDMFRDLPVVSFTTRQGLLDDNASAIEANRDGSVWIGTPGFINILRGQRFSYLKVPHAGNPGNVSIIFRNSQDQMWIVDDGQVFLYRNGRFDPLIGWQNVANHDVVCIAEDVHHQTWLLDHITGTLHYSLVRLKGTTVAETLLVPHALSQIEPDLRDGFWASGLLGGLFRFHDGALDRLPLIESNERILYMKADAEGALWFGGAQSGIVRYFEGRVQRLTSRNGLPCDAGYDTADDGQGSRWFYMRCGIVRVPNSELARWWRDSSYHVQSTIFNGYDDYKLQSYQDEVAAYFPSSGRLWSVSGTGAQRIDPSHLPSNAEPPPVHIEGLLVNHKEFLLNGKHNIPAAPREVEVDYTALSYVVPGRVRFRYRLLGHDKDWTDAGSRRQAFYTDLKPGHYTFQVIGCNNDGVWNNRGALLGFVVLPTWYQTPWFRLTCVSIGFVLVYSLYQLRIQRYSRAMKMRFDERLEERMRLARDLHDTLLQTIQGIKMVADQAKESAYEPAAASAFANRISEWSERASLEGRAALDSLRNSTTEGNDLAAAFRRSFENYVNDGTTSVNLSVTGKSKDMHPIARDEVYRIGDEAIRNACLHSGGQRIDIELVYDENMLLRVRDNGKGIDPMTLQAGKAGHYGLTGMRERATRIGAKLAISSSTQGTQLVLSVPGRAIYASPPLRTKWRGR
ncbi:sensor histidine kinase [Granulicella mallensis]|uniref:Ligand-binding sensor domain-containing protein/two-component sensor histidine kinase n=1 Tax=Granulicella mallensis TaxID=940614 RepID=A0A7W7ZV14_9BACT|nr:sensor histidine kinase [Granulicella mallensis]MBB5066224.1 ligand-binding sensor domain-containing protein/two-component sensor histidine kinase [Granulicella mallensis]